MRSRWRLLVVLAALLAAGCLGADAPAEEGTGGPGGDDTGQADQDDARDGSVTTLAGSEASTRFLGLAAFDGVPTEDVEPFVPGDLTPTECFYPMANGTVDVALFFEERTYQQMPFAGDPLHLVGLFACAERPGDLAREDANEPPWVRLLDWGDAEGYASFRQGIGAPTIPADVSMDPIPQGFTVLAEANGTSLVEARIVGSPVGIPAIEVESCEPIRQDGRSFFAIEGEAWTVLDWNKTEAICPAEAEITWPEDSPLADVLGPARKPSFVVGVHVEEARFWWRSLPNPTTAG